VIVFEQTAAALEKRLGFRVAEYGLRQVFARVPEHPIVAGLSEEHFRDWRGEATLSAPRLDYTVRPRYGPTVEWCGIPLPRLWRCGNRGNVASVLIEKPARGDFLPLLEGGYSLQYSPLLEFHEGQGMVIFCQLDITGRTEREPVADILARNIMRYVSDWKPALHPVAVYVGTPEGFEHIKSAGFNCSAHDRRKPGQNDLLILAPGAADKIKKADVQSWLQAGGRLLGLGLSGPDLALLPIDNIESHSAEHISTWFAATPLGSPFQGISPADLHNRDPRPFPVITSGATPLGDGILASTPDGKIVLCQMLPWQFDPVKQMNLKRTFRRAAFALSRLLANQGLQCDTSLLVRFSSNVGNSEQRYLAGLYLDQPEEWDDPYRHFRW
jgi:hypothetical protein